MNKLKSTFFALISIMGMATAAPAFAGDDVANSLVGVQGYDLVSYHEKAGPAAGNGNHVAEYNGVTYLFTSDEHKKAFEANPEKYLPQYGGYCAFGASVNKKFVGDPKVWALVDDKLYLNLDKKIQAEWNKDRAGRIKTADANWPNIKAVSAAKLNAK